MTPPTPPRQADSAKLAAAIGFAVLGLLLVSFPMDVLLPDLARPPRILVQGGYGLCVFAALITMRSAHIACALGLALCGLSFWILPLVMKLRPEWIAPVLSPENPTSGLSRFTANLGSDLLLVLFTGMGLLFGGLFLLAALLVALFRST